MSPYVGTLCRPVMQILSLTWCTVMRETLSLEHGVLLPNEPSTGAYMTTSNSQFSHIYIMLKVFNCFIRYFMNSCSTTLQTHVRIGIDLLCF